MNKPIMILPFLCFALTVPLQARLAVVASLPDFASIAAAVGGDKVDAMSIARGNANPHSVEVFPSYMARTARADLFIKSGLALDTWADPIIDGSRNNKLLVIDCSEGIRVLDKPSGKVDASRGDLHPDGNPHYWLDPRNGPVIAETIRRALVRKIGRAHV